MLDVVLSHLPSSTEALVGAVFMFFLALLGLMHVVEWWFKHFVLWTWKMRRLWKELRNAPPEGIVDKLI